MTSWTKTISPKSMASGMSVLKRYAKTQYGLEDEEEPRSFTGHLKHMYERSGAKYLMLLLLLGIYGVLGGLMFMFIEQQPELDEIAANKALNIQRRREFLTNFTMEFSLLMNLPMNACDAACIQYLEQHLKVYDDTTGVSNSEVLPAYNWNDFWTSSFYAGTLFTTIGYGNMSCRTKLGKAATIVYSLIGIPIMLMVLDHWGKLVFRKVRECWFWFLRTIRSQSRRFARMVASDTVAKSDHGSQADDDEELVNQIEDTVPLSLALAVVVFYTFFCAAFFKLWETEWSYFEAFYFFFVSLSTIGLGDQVPEHPKYALAAFILFVMGLALVSMCASVMGARIEAQYMAALMMVEQQAVEAVEQERAEMVASLESPTSPFRLSLPQADANLDGDRTEFEYPQRPGAVESPVPTGHSPSPGRLSARGGVVARRSPSLIGHMMMSQRHSSTSSHSDQPMTPTLGVFRSSVRTGQMPPTQQPSQRLQSRFQSMRSSGDQYSLPRSPFRRTDHPNRASTPADVTTVPMVTLEEADEPRNTRL